jgi:hypothetical protein
MKLSEEKRSVQGKTLARINLEAEALKNKTVGLEE